MNFGLPYMGSKNKIAQAIVDVLPRAEYFVDLFCGGCAVTHAAMVSNKFKKFIANDIPYRGTTGYVAGGFDHDAFYEWALSRPFRVFVSEYSMPSEFSCVLDIAHRSILSSSANNRVTEKLFCNRPMHRVGQLDLFAGVA